jgi:N-acylneuraminate cytidylyltransferase/CMP-N,N'-diacetyllegionaminic acid synthase
MCDLLVESYDNFDAVMCVGECSQHPSLVLDIDETGYLVGYEESVSKVSRRQDLSVLYYPSGTFIIKTSELLSKKSFYPPRAAAYKLQRHQCFEIDDIYDFLAVENIMKYQWKS